MGIPSYKKLQMAANMTKNLIYQPTIAYVQ